MRRIAYAATAGLLVTTGFVAGASEPGRRITAQMVAAFETITGLEFTDAERDSMRADLEDYRRGYAALRAVEIPNDLPPALDFDPVVAGGWTPRGEDRPIRLSPPEHRRRPENLEELAFWSVRDLAWLVRTRQVTSVELTELFLDRLERYGPELECVVTLTRERAMEAARRADAEIAAGHYRGPLHGIPYGAKDLFAVEGYPTTWGAAPYRDQVIDRTATVIRRLDEAGAVLVAKLTLGALAWGDVWFGGMTRNPWKLEQGSSGSSAGSAAATAAGLVPFAIGTETWGSIVSPSTRCGVTGLRPTFGRVSRAGAMALSWSMDKVGPIGRTVEDCAIVFDAIRGADGIDRTAVDAPFNYTPDVDLASLRIGYLADAFEAEDEPQKGFDRATLDVLRRLGADLVPVRLPAEALEAMPIILTAEAAAAFDDLTRSNRDDLLVRQVRAAWPNVLRSARLIPAVEYIQANRVRYRMMQRMDSLNVDVWVSPSFGGGNLLITNLTGHPCVVIPNGFREDGTPTSITFMGRLFGEDVLLAVARAVQEATGFHRRHPARYRPGASHR